LKGRRIVLPLLGLIAAAAVLRAGDGPTLRLSRDGAFLAMLPPASVLVNSDVRPRLNNGLTTSFSFTVTLRDAVGSEVKGGGRIDVRYELWEEVFLVHGIGIDGRRIEASLPSFDRLVAWWREQEVPVAPVKTVRRGGPWNVKLQVRVIPFSQGEQRDAQRWLSDSVRQGSADSSAADSGRSTSVLDFLVGTSIQRRALVGYDWNLTFLPERRPEPRP